MNDRSLLADFGDASQRLDRALKALQVGKGVLLVDDENRENEGDLIFSAQKMSIPDMALMIRHCSGIVCLCLTDEKARSLGLVPMVAHNTSRYGTAFTISIEAAEGVTTGVSAVDRIRTIQAAIAPHAAPSDLNHPGHIFPLIARSGGVLERPGHTEGSVDLVKMAGLPPQAVLCELTNDDGTMAKLPQICAFAKLRDLTVVSIQDIIERRTRVPCAFYV